MAKRSWLADVDWFWVVIGLLLIIPVVSSFIKDRDNAKRIEACIQSGRNPKIEHGELKECK